MNNIQQNEIVAILGQVVDVLSSLRIPYMLTGSMASGIRGTFRATNDIDFVAALEQNHIAPFCAKLQTDFFVDSHSVADAVRNERSFNIIHEIMLIKVDFFVRTNDQLSKTQIQRATLVSIPSLQTPVATATAEDVILSKLHWYELGNRVSERQWRDVLGVIAVNSPELDRQYLETMAHELGFSSLLLEALEQTNR